MDRPITRGDAELKTRLLTLVLIVGLATSVALLVPRLRGHHLPGNQQGYEPIQPIAFSHRQHAGDLQISCVYCHSGAEKGPHAGIPAASVCMNCHRFVTASSDTVLAAYAEARKAGQRPPARVVAPELQKIFDALGLDEKMQTDPAKSRQPIHWVRVHNLPSFTRFDHRAHVNSGVSCERCHGAVQTMERVRQVEDLSMGWCVNCHREAERLGVAGKDVHPSTDCAACHH
jgi:hypothetical protein